MAIMAGDAKFVSKVSQMLVTRLTGYITIGSTGAISAQSSTATATSGGQQAGISWTRNTTGDYRGTFHRGYKRVIRANCQVHHPTAGTAPTTTAGNLAFIQGLTAANFAGSTTVPTTGLGITTVRGEDTLALADPTNGVTISYDIELADQ